MEMTFGGPDDPFEPLRLQPERAQRVVQALIAGKHIDLYLVEEFRFLEDHPAAWEAFFTWMGYRLVRSELGGSPFYFLQPVSEGIPQSRLSRGATFLGLYLAWHFFSIGPGEADWIAAPDLFQRLLSSYDFNLLRTVFIRRMGPLSAMELSEDQVEKLRGYVRRELVELARYRSIELRPSVRASWEELLVYRLPALHRFWELALHMRARGGDESEASLDGVIQEIWGSIESDADEEEP